jgi:hypothetical protein
VRHTRPSPRTPRPAGFRRSGPASARRRSRRPPRPGRAAPRGSANSPRRSRAAAPRRRGPPAKRAARRAPPHGGTGRSRRRRAGGTRGPPGHRTPPAAPSQSPLEQLDHENPRPGQLVTNPSRAWRRTRVPSSAGCRPSRDMSNRCPRTCRTTAGRSSTCCNPSRGDERPPGRNRRAVPRRVAIPPGVMSGPPEVKSQVTPSERACSDVNIAAQRRGCKAAGQRCASHGGMGRLLRSLQG